jgi:hypothetical protein
MTTKVKASDERVAASSSTRQRGGWLMKCGLLATTVVLSLGMCELVARWLVPQSPSWLAIYRRLPELPFYGFQPNARQSVDTGETSWTVITDSQGDRIAASQLDAAPAVDEAAGAAQRPWALCLGDSFLFAHGVDQEQSFVGRLDQDAVAGLEWTNAGVPGYGPVQYRQVLEHRLRQGTPPRHVLIATFLGNDFQDCIWNKDLPVTDGILGKRSSWLHTLKENSHLYRLFARVYHQAAVQEPAEGLNDPEGESVEWQGEFLQQAEQKFREEFERIATLCREAGCELQVVIIPSREEVARQQGEGIDEGATISETRRRSRQIFDDLQIAYLDVTPDLCEVPYQVVFYHFDGHLTPQGHEIVYHRLQEALMEPSSDSPVE